MESLLIEKANSILPMSVFELKHKEQIMRLKSERHNNTYYDIIYKCLVFMQQNPTPLSKYRISTKKSILDLLITNELIIECDSILAGERNSHKDTKHYVISSKGLEYMKRYEKLGEMFL